MKSPNIEDIILNIITENTNPIKSAAFDAIIDNNPVKVVKTVMDLCTVTRDTDIDDIIKYFIFALEAGKTNHELYMITCYKVCKRLNDFDPDVVAEVEEIIKENGNAQYGEIVSIAKKAAKNCKRWKLNDFEAEIGKIGISDWAYPDSSSIYRYKYDPKTMNLYVQFTTGTKSEKIYTYVNVPIWKFQEFHRAELKGEYFDQNISVQHDVKNAVKG